MRNYLMDNQEKDLNLNFLNKSFKIETAITLIAFSLVAIALILAFRPQFQPQPTNNSTYHNTNSIFI